MMRNELKSMFVAVLVAASGWTGALAQNAAQTPQPPADDQSVRMTLPTVTVTAQKEPQEIQKLPLSVTAVTQETIDRIGLRTVSDAVLFSPNTFFSDFSARKLSNPRIRGIGSSPANPAITTYVDGVPQINANSSNFDLLDVDQIEFVRGPQSALFGRNALGGVINVTTRRPSRSAWTGSAQVPFGNHGAWEVGGGASGPLVAGKVSAGVAFRHAEREGFTVNPLTGNDIDHRSAFSGKGQVFFTPNSDWEARVIVSGERARDGDYALNDLAALRERPHESSRDFEGFTNRNIFSTTLQARRISGPLRLTSTTGLVRWTTEDATDLDYTPLPLTTRTNDEKDFLFTQEVRIASADDAAVKLAGNASMSWQAGVFLFTQNYEQAAANTLLPALTQLPFNVVQHSPDAELQDFGLGVFGQGTVTLSDRLEVLAGARVDYENKSALLSSFSEPAIAPPSLVDAEDSFSNVSPQLAVSYSVAENGTVYGTVAGGFKAGGFNPASPVGNEVYNDESSWNLEGGYKGRFANGRVAATAAVFFIDWNDLQLNLPNPAVPGQFYIANAGGASSKGIELEVSARPAPRVDVFGSLGYTHARFTTGAAAIGAVEGNEIPNTPDYTASAGVQYSAPLPRFTASWYARGDLVMYGAFKYDEANTAGQDAYSLVNLRAGVRGRLLLVEGWVKNLFDTEYIPVAFSYPGLAPSGFIGESGAPRTFGVSAGVRF